MMDYRCYLLGNTGKIEQSEEFQAADDTVAIAKARELLKATRYPGVELWHLTRIIYAEGASLPKRH